MRLRKILSLVLSLCLLMTMLPLHTLAAAETQTNKQVPLYAHLKDSTQYPKIQIEEITRAPEETLENPDVFWEGNKTYAPTYLPIEEAALKLRENMKARKTSFDLYVQAAGTGELSNYQNVVNELMRQATAHTGKPTEGDYLLWQIGQWGGTVEQNNALLHYKVEMTYYTTAEQEKELTTAVNSLLKTLNVKDKNDYEKVKAVYDYICNNVTYDEANLEDETYLLKHTAYAALINKTAVCQGYATLLYRLLLELGVDNRVIAGQVLTGLAHSWNIVKLGNVYYNLDATFDSATEPDAFFLRNSVLNVTHYRYMDYMTTQFHRDYPMSETDYAEGVEGVPEYYFVYGTCGENAYWAIDRDGKLTIGGAGETTAYSFRTDMGEQAPWINWYDGFDTVIVEEGITALGANSFYQDGKRTNIVSVTLPESLTAIQYQAFKYCGQLTQINIPNGVKEIGAGAFNGCGSLQTVTLGNSVEVIGYDAFLNCYDLEQINLPASLKEIGQAAFRDCRKLTEIHIPDGVTKIEDYTFYYCHALETVTLGNSVETIGNYAFESCRALKGINFPASLKHLKMAFRYCNSLTEVTISAEKVDGSAFAYCDNLQTVRFDSEMLWDSTFYGCDNLRSVELSDKVTYIGSSAFRDCYALKSITIPEKVTTVSSHSFWYCTSLEQVYFQGDAPTFEMDVFFGDTLTCYYPAGNETWTEAVMQNYGGTVTWVSYCNHQWSGDNCDKPRTCTLCGETTGRDGHVYDDGVDGTCNVCGIHRETTENRTVMHMFRMYDPNSGEHFYTGSEVERENLVAAGWNYEGVGFTFSRTTGAPVYRLYDRYNTFEHLYTMDEAEKNKLIAQGWELEGIAFNSAYDTEVPQYRLHNPNETRGAYHFTASEEERDALIAAGWEYEGIGFYSSWK